jgi:lysine 2,3-aminomutase
MASMSNRQMELAEQIDNGTDIDHWRDWHWQMRHAVRDLETFQHLTGIQFTEEQERDLKLTLAKFPLAVTPYYLSLIDTENWDKDPVCMQAFPSPAELQLSRYDMIDPLSEDEDSPVPCITHRYPDRVLFLVSGLCSMYCRHCTRKRKVGDRDTIPSQEEMQAGIDYIKANPVIRDVLLSGGDPFLLDNERLDWLLGELHAIEHVEVVRIGTRTPVVLPFRITDELVNMLKKHHPVWINTHFNHPRELTQSAREALAKLANAGIPLGNQSVLLAGVNDCPRIMKALVQKLVQNRVRPYYLYQCDLAEGLGHFRTPIGKGIEIMESLIGHTSGFAVPTYVIDAPGGGGKIRVGPNYIISWSTNKVVLRNYEGVITTYKEPDSYEAGFCDRECARCDLQLNLDTCDEAAAIGIHKLLADYDETIALTPEDNERAQRRDEP